MKFVRKQTRWERPRWEARKGGFMFKTREGMDGVWSVFVSHSKKDIKFNSLWEDIFFRTNMDAQAWCETFDYTKHECLGDDVDKV